MRDSESVCYRDLHASNCAAVEICELTKNQTKTESPVRTGDLNIHELGLQTGADEEAENSEVHLRISEMHPTIQCLFLFFTFGQSGSQVI